MGRFHPPKLDAGDANTIGGYRAVHERPAAFEASDGSAYSVEIVVDKVGDERGRYGAYLLFVRWRASEQVASGHLETGYIAFGETEESARDELGTLKLSEVKRTLDDLVACANPPAVPWYRLIDQE